MELKNEAEYYFGVAITNTCDRTKLPTLTKYTLSPPLTAVDDRGIGWRR